MGLLHHSTQFYLRDVRRAWPSAIAVAALITAGVIAKTRIRPDTVADWAALLLTAFAVGLAFHRLGRYMLWLIFLWGELRKSGRTMAVALNEPFSEILYETFAAKSLKQWEAEKQELRDSLRGQSDVYVQLLEEGTTVYRSTRAIALNDGSYRLLPVGNYNWVTEKWEPVDEKWEFAPQTIVEVQEVVRGGERILIATRAKS